MLALERNEPRIPPDDARTTTDPLRLAVVDDFDVIVAGLARLMEPFPDRIRIVELDVDRPVTQPVDIALVDTFGQGEAHTDDLVAVLDSPMAARVAIYSWRVDDELVEIARRRGFAGYLSKQLQAEELVGALERIHRGPEMVVVTGGDTSRPAVPPREWPGREHGLSEREAETLVLLTKGHNNREIADLLYLSENSIKTYTRTLYQKLGVRRRSHALLWGIDHGFRVDRSRTLDWHSPS